MSSAEKARLETQLADAKKRMEAIVTKNIELENQLLELRRSAGEAVGKQERTVGMTRETLEQMTKNAVDEESEKLAHVA